MEIQKQVWEDLLAPAEEVQLQVIQTPQRSRFNINLTPLRVCKSWFREGTKIFQAYAFATTLYPNPSLNNGLDVVIKKVNHLRVEAILSDMIDRQGTAPNGRFLQLWRNIRKQVGDNPFHSITTTFGDYRKDNVEDGIITFCAALCQGLQFLRSKEVHTKNLPPRIEDCLISELLSQNPSSTDLPGMIMAMRRVCRTIEAVYGSRVLKIADRATRVL